MTIGLLYTTPNISIEHYIDALLNSSTPNHLMKDFQTSSLSEPTNVHKKILDIYFPKFDRENGSHLKLARLSRDLHTKSAKFLKENHPEEDLTPIALGRLRMKIKEHLKEELLEIDKIVKKLIK